MKHAQNEREEGDDRKRASSRAEMDSFWLYLGLLTGSGTRRSGTVCEQGADLGKEDAEELRSRMRDKETLQGSMHVRGLDGPQEGL